MPQTNAELRGASTAAADDLVLSATTSTLSNARRVLSDTADMVHPMLRWQLFARRRTHSVPSAGDENSSVVGATLTK
jgi:hypothetical protein